MFTNNIFKKLFIIAIVFSFFTAFTSYTSSSENLDDQAYVMGIGIDKGTTSRLKISFQISTLESNSSDASIKSSENTESSSSTNESSSSYVIHTVESDSLDSAINIEDAYLNRNVDLSHCKILLLSEDIAKDGIENIVNALINKVEVRPDCNIIISKVPENEFENKEKPKLENFLDKYYDVTANSETGRGYSQLIKLNDFYLSLNDYFCQPCATLGITTNTQKSTVRKNENNISNLDIQSRSFVSTPKESNVETIGLAVFKKDILVGELSANQTLCQEILINNFNFCTINIPSPFNNNETIDLQLSHLKKPKIKVKIKNGSPFIDVKLYITVKILSFNSNTINVLTEDKLEIIKDSATKYIQSQFYDYFNKTSKELNSDIAGFGKYAIKNFSTIEDWEKYNWLENYKNSTFKISIIPSIKSGHLLTNE